MKTLCQICSYIIFFLLILTLPNTVVGNESYSDDFIEKYDNRDFNNDFSESANLEVDENIEIVPEEILDNVNMSEDNDVLTDNTYLQDKFDAIFDSEVFQELQDLDLEQLKNVELPAGISKNIGSNQVSIAIVKAYFAVDYIVMDVFVKIIHKDKNGDAHELKLGAWGVKSYYSKGWQEVNFALLQNVNLPLSENIKLQLAGNFDNESGSVDLENACHISIKCDGINSLQGHFQGKVMYENEDIYMVERQGDSFKRSTESGFNMDFETEASLEELYFKCAEEPRYFTYGNTDVIFELNTFVLDFSINQSEESFINSETKHLNATVKNVEWEGLYLHQFMVYLPEEITSDGDYKRLAFGSKDLIFDQNGFSVGLSVENLNTLSYVRGMPVQPKSVELIISRNDIETIGLHGLINPEYLKEDQYADFGFEWMPDKENNIDKYVASIEYRQSDDQYCETSFLPAKISELKASFYKGS